MVHIDPLLILQLKVPPSGQVSEEDIRRAKRRLQAEFELAGTVTIRVQGREIDRSTAIRAVESLEDPRTLANWVALHRIPNLRDFIQHPQPSGIQKLPALETVPPGAFRDFVREQLVAPLTDLMDKAVRGQQWVDARQVLWRLEWVPYADQLRVVAPMTRHIWRMHTDLRHIISASKADLDGLWNPRAYDDELVKTINTMPADAQNAINRLVNAMVRAAQNFLRHKGEDWTEARILMDHAIRLRSDRYVRNEVEDLHAYLFYGHRVPYKAKRITDQNRRHARALFWVVWLLVLLAAAIRIWTDWLPMDIGQEPGRGRYGSYASP